MSKGCIRAFFVALAVALSLPATTSSAGIGRYLYATNSTNETVLLSQVKDGGTLIALGRVEPGQTSRHYIGEPNELTVAHGEGRTSGKIWRLSIARDKDVNDCAWTIRTAGPYYAFDCE